MPRTKVLALGVASMILACGLAPAGAQVSKEAEKEVATDKLEIGQKAPAFAVERIIKGEKITGFEKGKIYVVEFWATWCGPCIAAFPHLSELQHKYKSEGLTVIGVNIWERYDDSTSAKVDEFVSKQGERMGYTVAYDGTSKKMDEAYMEAAGRNGIPSAFVVDREGKIAWIGHPMWLGAVISDITKDKWDYVKGPEKLAKGEERLNAIFVAMRENPESLVGLIEKFDADYPTVLDALGGWRMTMYFAAGAYDKAYEMARKATDKAIAAKDAQGLNEIAWTIVDPDGNVEQKDLPLAMRAAMAAAEFSEHNDAAILDTLARVYFLTGDVERAIELQTKAVELAEGRMKSDLEAVLKEYKAAKRGG